MELNNSTVVKTPEAEAEAPTPTRIQLPLSKTSPFSNGVLKRHAPPQPHLHPPLVVAYRECLKNHAAALGGLAVDGCGEFMPSPSSNPADPTSLRCAACGCHRNFHRREPEETPPPHPHPPFLLPAPHQPAALEYRPHHRHHPPPPGSPDESPSPPPISSAYYPSAPHMLLALGHPDGGAQPIPAVLNPNAGGRKRFRTKFTHGQKEKMQELAERVGWKMQRRDEDLINGFCGEIGVDKGVFKVWMHNNKNTLGKKEHFSTPPAANGAAVEDHYHHRRPEENNDGGEENVHDHNGSARIIGTNNGSSSTS